MKFDVVMSIPEWVTIPTSELASQYIIGRVVETSRNSVKVVWMGRDGPHVGIYTPAIHIFREPTDAEWHKYYELNA